MMKIPGRIRGSPRSTKAIPIATAIAGETGA